MYEVSCSCSRYYPYAQLELFAPGVCHSFSTINFPFLFFLSFSLVGVEIVKNTTLSCIPCFGSCHKFRRENIWFWKFLFGVGGLPDRDGSHEGWFDWRTQTYANVPGDASGLIAERGINRWQDSRLLKPQVKENTRNEKKYCELHPPKWKAEI